MRLFLALICLCFAKVCFGMGQLQKPAILLLPETIKSRMGAGYSLSGEISLRWDGPEPLRMSVWRDSKSGEGDRLMPSIRVFDEIGKEVDQQFFVSLPPIPTGQVVIGKGERRQFKFFIWNGEVVFRRPGNYYAIATFSDAWTGETNVYFTTSKRWFKVVEVPPKPDAT